MYMWDNTYQLFLYDMRIKTESIQSCFIDKSITQSSSVIIFFNPKKKIALSVTITLSVIIDKCNQKPYQQNACKMESSMESTFQIGK